MWLSQGGGKYLCEGLGTKHFGKNTSKQVRGGVGGSTHGLANCPAALGLILGGRWSLRSMCTREGHYYVCILLLIF